MLGSRYPGSLLPAGLADLCQVLLPEAKAPFLQLQLSPLLPLQADSSQGCLLLLVPGGPASLNPANPFRHESPPLNYLQKALPVSHLFLAGNLTDARSQFPSFYQGALSTCPSLQLQKEDP